MNTHTDKASNDKSRSVANAVSQTLSPAAPTFQFVDNRPQALAQRRLQVAADHHSEQQSSQGLIQRKVTTAIGQENVTVDDTDHAVNTMAFLTPNTQAGLNQNDSAPVHLTKNVNKAGSVGKIQAANVANAPALTHASLNAENAGNLNEHLTLTSGFMTAALCSSRIPRYMVKTGKANKIWTHHGISTQELSQNKLMANAIVGEFFEDLNLELPATFDNLMFIHDPGGSGPTFANVVAFHDAIYNTLNATPNVNPDGEVPFANVSYTTMRNQIMAGGNAMAANWANWTGGGAAQLGDFRIPQNKWNDLAKAANILTRLRTRVLRVQFTKGQAVEHPNFSNKPFDRNFFKQNLFGGANNHNAELNAIEGNMDTHHETHDAELGQTSMDQMKAFITQKIDNHDSVDLNNYPKLHYLYNAVRNFAGRLQLPGPFGAGATLEKNDEPGEAPLIIWYDAQSAE